MGNLADSKFVCIGIDFSINSPAVVALDSSGGIFGCLVINDTKKFAKVPASYVEVVYREPRKRANKKQDGEDLDYFRYRRNIFTANTIAAWVAHQCTVCGADSCLVSIEGLAVGSANSRYLDIAEATGYVKCALARTGRVALLRVHDPLTVKVWATGSGNASKYHMRDKFAFSLPDALFVRGSAFKYPIVGEDGRPITHDIAGPGTDVIDAYFLAQMMQHELWIRSGERALQSLSDKQIEIFNRVTKTYPESILSRTFV